MVPPDLDWPTIAEIRAIFAEEVTAQKGTVLDTFDDGSRLFLRATLPQIKELVPGDGLKGGVALKATDRDIWVHPYVLRLICTNGAIGAHAPETRHIGCTDPPIPTKDREYGIAALLRETIQECVREETFASSAQEMDLARTSPFDPQLTLVLQLLRRTEYDPERVSMRIARLLFDNRDKSRYGLTNIVTAVARDTRAPEVRWELERLGGRIPATTGFDEHQLITGIEQALRSDSRVDIDREDPPHGLPALDWSPAVA